MLINKWITISSKGAVKMTATRPKLAFNEISMNLNIKVPDAIFEKPRLIANITVPDEAAASEVVKSIVCDNVKEVIEQATGLQFAISVVDPSTNQR